MKIIHFILITSLTIPMLQAQKNLIPSTIQNKKTAQHQLISGTRAAIIFPTTQEQSSLYPLKSWHSDDEKSSIIIFEKFTQYNSKGDFTQNRPQKDDFSELSEEKLATFQTLTVLGFPAVCYILEKTLTNYNYEALDLINQKIDSVKQLYLKKYKLNENKLNYKDVEKMEEFLTPFRMRFGREIPSETTTKLHRTVLTFGDKDFTLQMEASYPADDTLIATTVLKSLSSVVYDKNQQAEEIVKKAAGASLNTQNSNFKLSTVDQVMLIYKPHSTEETEERDELENPQIPTLTLMPVATHEGMAWNDPHLEMAKTQTLQIMAMNKGQANILKSGDIKVNGYQAHEIEALIQGGEVEYIFYSLLLMHQSKAVSIYGLAPLSKFKDHSEFRKLAYTVRFE
jgi:hypothetical protein